MGKYFRPATLEVALCVLGVLTALDAQAKWSATGPFGGNAEVITASTSDPSLLLAGTKNANLFISRNGGESWGVLRFPRQYTSMLHTLVIDPRNPSVFYAAISDEPRVGLYRSSDAGATWEAVNGLAREEVYSLAISPSDPDIIAAGLRHSVWLSRNGGRTWKAISPADNIELQPVVSVAFDPANPDVIYAGTPRLPWKTTDGGAHWDLIANGMSTDSDIISVRVDPTKSSRVFIGACSGFWHSNNGGAQWAKTVGIPFSSRRTYSFVQDPDHPEIIYAGTSRGLYRTKDGGSDWRNIATHEIKSLAIVHGTLYVATADAGLFRSVNQGSTLQPINEGFTSRNFSVISEEGENIYTGTRLETDAGMIFSSSDGGSHWTQIATAAQMDYENVSSVVRTNAGTVVAATASAMFRSTDAGQSWTRLKPANAPSKVTALVAAPSAILAGTDAGIFHSLDDGKTWNPIAGVGKEPVRVLLNSGALLALLSRGLLVSSDDGATWQKRRLPFFAETYDIAATKDTVIAGTSRGVFRSEDGAETWHAAMSGLPNASITTVAIDPVSGTLAYAFEYGNVYRSTDAGKTWLRFDQEGLEGASVKHFAITTHGPHHLLAVTATRGIFVRDIEEGPASSSTSSAVDLRKDGYVPNQQNDKSPAF